MNQLSRINSFLIQYHFKNPNLQYLCKGSYEYYSKLLIKEYIKVSKHPYPQEYF